MSTLCYLLCFAILCLSLAQSNAKVYQRCQLARELHLKHGFPLEELSSWLCILFWESGFNSKAYRIGNFDGSKNYGMFQINDMLWCQPSGAKNNTNFCDKSCSHYIDNDIADDVQCARIIFGMQGFPAWGVYESKCKANSKSFISGCGLEDEAHEKDIQERQLVSKATEKINGKNEAQLMLQSSLTEWSKNLQLLRIDKRSKNSSLNSREGVKKRRKRGILGYGHDSINPFEDARVFLFNPLCCFGWKAADLEMSNMKNWLRDIRTTVG